MRRAFTFIVFALICSLPLSAQRNRDPLTEKEADQIRELAEDPVKRIRLMVKFARARMAVIEQLRSDQKMASEQADKIGDLLEEFSYLVDEIDDNLSSYDNKGQDLRKALRTVIEADTEFQLKLRTIRESAPPEQLKQFSFALESATDSVNASADSARAMLDDQVAKKGKEKPEKEDKSKDAKNVDVKVKDRDQSRPDYTGMGGIGDQRPR